MHSKQVSDLSIIFVDFDFADFIIITAMTETCSNTYRYMEYHS